MKEIIPRVFASKGGRLLLIASILAVAMVLTPLIFFQQPAYAAAEPDDETLTVASTTKTYGPFKVEMDYGYEDSYYDSTNNTLVISGTGSSGGFFKVRKDPNTTLSDTIANSCAIKVKMTNYSTPANIDLVGISLASSSITNACVRIEKGDVYVNTDNVNYAAGCAFMVLGNSKLRLNAPGSEKSPGQTFTNNSIIGYAVDSNGNYGSSVGYGGTITLEGNIKAIQEGIYTSTFIGGKDVNLDCDSLDLTYYTTGSTPKKNEPFIYATNEIRINSGNIDIESKDNIPYIKAPKVTVTGGTLSCMKKGTTTQLISADELVVEGGTVLQYNGLGYDDEGYTGTLTIKGGIILDGKILRIAGGSLPDSLYTNNELTLNSNTFYSTPYPHTITDICVELTGTGWTIPQGKSITCSLPITCWGKITNLGTLNLNSSSYNNGNITNQGTLNANGNFGNYGNVTNAEGATLDINGNLTATDSASLTNDGYLNNSRTMSCSAISKIKNNGTLSWKIASEADPPQIINGDALEMGTDAKMCIKTKSSITSGKYYLISTNKTSSHNENLKANFNGRECILTGVEGETDKKLTVGGESVKYGNNSYKLEISSNTVMGTGTYLVLNVAGSPRINTSYADFEYTGSEIKLPLNVSDEKNNKLSEGTDYEISYKNNINAGTATATVKMKGYYADVLSIPYTINAKDISKMELKLSPDSFIYTGTACEPAVSVEGLVAGTDYSVTYENNNKAGTGKVTVTGIGNYSGSITKSFSIICKHGSSKKISVGSGCYYIQCAYCGAKYSYTSPCYVKSFKLKKGSKSFTVKWKKQSKSTQKKFTGYRIRYSLKSDMSNAKTVYAGKSSYSKKISKLAKGRKYYVEIRSYVKKGNIKYFSKAYKKSVVTK